MNHAPRPDETSFISSIGGIANADVAYVRLTGTMLSKSIIDAHEVVRVVLRNAGVVDYALLGQGTKTERELAFVTTTGCEQRAVSFYRPKTKNGDPRLWISGLKSLAEPDSLLVLGVAGGEPFAFVLAGSLPDLRNQIATLLADLGAYDLAFESDVQDLTSAIRDVAGRGWIDAIGVGAPAVGETLEHALGITRNPFRSPDFRGRIEIKSARDGGSALQTLFSQTPLWAPPIGGTRDLVLAHGRYNNAKQRSEIYCTVTQTTNTLGWRLAVEPESEHVVIQKGGKGVLFYPFARLRGPLEEKHRATMFVKASHRRVHGREQFQYVAATLRVRASFSNFLTELHAGNSGLDLVAHVKGSKARDHGYLWRIRRERIRALFAFERRLL